MPSFAIGHRAYPVSTELGLAVNFSMLSSAASTIVNPASSATFKSGGPAGTAPANLIGSSQHYGDALSIAAIADVEPAYNYYKALSLGGQIYNATTGVPLGTSPNFSGDIANLRFTEGVYGNGSAAAVSNSISITFDAENHPYAKFVMNFGGVYAAAAATNIILLNGAKAENIFWVVTGAPSIGASSHHEGTIIALGATTIGAGTTINGRLLSIQTGAISLDNNVITTKL